MDNLVITNLTIDMIEDVFEIEKTFFDVTNNDSIVSSLNNEHLSYLVLYCNDQLVGFLECSIILDEAELFEIAIKRDFQGKGFSNRLMNYFIDYCKDKSVNTIFLEVNKINNKAISLYKKFGFTEYSIRKKYYGDNDAILMKKVLN